MPLADRDRVVLWNTAVSVLDITAASPWSFRFFINADVDATMMGEYAVKRRGLRRLAVVYINDEMGLSYDNVFQKTVRSAGGEIVASEGFGFGVTDFKPLLLKIAAAKPDGIYIQVYDDAIGRIPVQMIEMGLIIPILSVGTISQPQIMRQAENNRGDCLYHLRLQYLRTWNPRSQDLCGPVHQVQDPPDLL